LWYLLALVSGLLVAAKTLSMGRSLEAVLVVVLNPQRGRTFQRKKAAMRS
jgi:hypothetical protein